MGECPDCHGAGYVLALESVPCQACNNTGKILGAVCVCCNGAGTQLVEVRSDCLLCGGRGEYGNSNQNISIWRGCRDPLHETAMLSTDSCQ
jgi:DnaJ-class molecular chaperone